MTWNHRVIRHRIRKSIIDGGVDEYWFGIHEVYYDESGKPDMVTEEPIQVIGDNLEELKQTLKWMLKSLKAPILDYENDFPSRASR